MNLHAHGTHVDAWPQAHGNTRCRKPCQRGDRRLPTGRIAEAERLCRWPRVRPTTSRRCTCWGSSQDGPDRRRMQPNSLSRALSVNPDQSPMPTTIAASRWASSSGPPKRWRATIAPLRSSPITPTLITIAASRCTSSTVTSEALESYERAIAIKPATPKRTTIAASCSTTSSVMRRRWRATSAPSHSGPTMPAPTTIGASRSVDLQRLAEALASYERAIALKPDYAEAHNNRGNVLIDLERRGGGAGEPRARHRAQARLRRRLVQPRQRAA